MFVCVQLSFKVLMECKIKWGGGTVTVIFTEILEQYAKILTMVLDMYFW